MSTLLASTIAALKGYRAPHPTFSNMIAGELHDFQSRRGRFKVLVRLDRKFVAFDPYAPNGQGGRGVFDTLEDAVARVQALSDEADARGESNSPDRHGWRLNFDDPKNWENTPMKRGVEPTR